MSNCSAWVLSKLSNSNRSDWGILDSISRTVWAYFKTSFHPPQPLPPATVIRLTSVLELRVPTWAFQFLVSYHFLLTLLCLGIPLGASHHSKFFTAEVVYAIAFRIARPHFDRHDLPESSGQVSPCTHTSRMLRRRSPSKMLPPSHLPGKMIFLV